MLPLQNQPGIKQASLLFPTQHAKRYWSSFKVRLSSADFRDAPSCKLLCWGRPHNPQWAVCLMSQRAVLYIFPPGNEKSITECIHWLLALSPDPSGQTDQTVYVWWLLPGCHGVLHNRAWCNLLGCVAVNRGAVTQGQGQCGHATELLIPAFRIHFPPLRNVSKLIEGWSKLPWKLKSSLCSEWAQPGQPQDNSNNNLWLFYSTCQQ